MTSGEMPSILEVLRFIKGGISRKDHLPILQHVCIREGSIQSGNGTIALCAPFPHAIDCNPRAVPFINAIGACESLDEVPALSLLENGRLRIRAGQFRVNIECSPTDFPWLGPEGQFIELQSGLLKAFEILDTFISEDASRPWARGILIRDGSAYATNNVVIGQYWIGWKFSFDMNIPDECVREVIRIGQEPIGINASDHSVTFHYPDGRWIRSQLLSTVWPAIEPVLDRPATACKLPPDFFVALTHLEPHCGEHRSIHFRDSRTLATHLNEQEGATFTLSEPLAEVPIQGRYNIDQLRHLKNTVATVDWTLYPAPALFYSDIVPLRGAIVGMREL